MIVQNQQQIYGAIQMTEDVKKLLDTVVSAVIHGDTKAADAALSECLKLKTQKIILGESDDELDIDDEDLDDDDVEVDVKDEDDDLDDDEDLDDDVEDDDLDDDIDVEIEDEEKSKKKKPAKKAAAKKK